jgi:WhiB family redox-sensing transcriptional regulator
MIIGLADAFAAPEPWVAQAICSQTDPELFWPTKGGSTVQGKAVCLGCPVIAECLAFALEHNEPGGIWGGLTARERTRLKRTGNAKRTQCARGHFYAKVGRTSQGSCRECRRRWEHNYWLGRRQKNGVA